MSGLFGDARPDSFTHTRQRQDGMRTNIGRQREFESLDDSRQALVMERAGFDPEGFLIRAVWHEVVDELAAEPSLAGRGIADRTYVAAASTSFAGFNIFIEEETLLHDQGGAL